MKTLCGILVLFAISIAAVMTSLAEDKTAPEEITLIGVVAKAPDVSFCMDGAAHVLLSSENGRTNTMRLKAKTENVKKQLDQLLGANVTVTGKKNAGVECKAFEVSSVAEV